MLLTARTLDVKHVALNSGRLPLTLFDVPELLSRRKTKTNRGRNKRVLVVASMNAQKLLTKRVKLVTGKSILF